MGTRLLRRRLTAAGVLAAGVLSGCQSGGQFQHTGVARGDLVGTTGSSATTRLTAGQALPVAPATGGIMMPSSDAGALVTSGPMVMESNPPTPNSGGTVYAAGYTPGSPMPAAMQVQPAGAVQPGPTWAPAGPMMPVQAMTIQTTAMPPLMQASAIPGMPVTTTTAMPPAPPPGTVGTPTLMLIQGPNGPQYVITEVLSAVPLPAPTATPIMMPVAAPMPVPTPVYASAPPVPMAAPGPVAPMAPVPVMPAPTPAPEPVPAPAVTPVAIPSAAPAPAPDPLPPAAPTFTAPPPANVPMPAAPKELGRANPDRLPPTVSFKPSGGPVLPASDMTASNSSAPMVTTTAGPKLPAATGVTDDDIPAAPVFLPVAR